MATAYLPNIELRTEDFSVIVDEDSITVRITGLSPDAADTDCSEGNRRRSGNGMTGRSRHNDCGCKEDDWNPEEDEEEEKVYDEY